MSRTHPGSIDSAEIRGQRETFMNSSEGINSAENGGQRETFMIMYRKGKMG